MTGKLLADTFVHSWLGELADAGSLSPDCCTVRQLEEYVTGRTALLVGSKLLAHVTVCGGCRHRLTALGEMEARSNCKVVWVLPYLRSMVKCGSSLAKAAACGTNEWLAGMSSNAALEVYSEELVIPMANGLEKEVPARLLAPLKIDSQGRLVLAMNVGLPFGCPADATLSLEDQNARLVLFSTRVTSGRIDAIIDLACCGRESLRIPGSKLLVQLIGNDPAVSAETNLLADIDFLANRLPLDSGLVDGMLKLAEEGRLTRESIRAELAASPDYERSLNALRAAADALGRYTQMWVVGNQGEIPEAAADLLAVITCELETSKKPAAAVSTDLGGKSDLRISRPIERKHLKIERE